MPNIPKLRLVLARLEKSAGWIDMVQRAIAKLPGRTPQASQLGKQLYRGFPLGAEEIGFKGIEHASLHPSVAAGHATNVGGPLQYVLKKFDSDPQLQKHFPHRGLLSSLGFPGRTAEFKADPIGYNFRATGRTIPEVQQFLKDNPIYHIPKAQANPANYPIWAEASRQDGAKGLGHLGYDANYEWSTVPAKGWNLFGRQGSIKELFKDLTHETGVHTDNFSGLVSYDWYKNKLADIPHNIAKDLIKGAGVAKEELPWRNRVEVYTRNPKGKIYGGIWDNDKSFALPGGGIDEGEDPLIAALRELKEETGINAKNPRLLPIGPIDSPWSDAHRAKTKRNFAGSRTHFVLADASGKGGGKNLDIWDASDRGYYTPAEAIAIMTNNTNYMAPTAAAARLKALQHIQSLAKAAAAKKELVRIKLENDEGKPLMHHYLNAKKWDYPAGKVEPNEKLEDAAVRELLERTGYSMDKRKLKYNGLSDGYHQYSGLLADIAKISPAYYETGEPRQLSWGINSKKV